MEKKKEFAKGNIGQKDLLLGWEIWGYLCGKIKHIRREIGGNIGERYWIYSILDSLPSMVPFITSDFLRART